MYQTNSPILCSHLQSYSMELQQCSHKITASLRLEMTLVGLQSNLLLKARSTQNSDQVSQGFVHLGLENLQKLETTQPLWSSVPKHDYPLSECVFPCIQADSLSPVSIWALPLSCHCGPQCVLGHLLFCLGRFGNNAKTRQAAMEKIRTLKLDYHRDWEQELDEIKCSGSTLVNSSDGNRGNERGNWE